MHEGFKPLYTMHISIHSFHSTTFLCILSSNHLSSTYPLIHLSIHPHIHPYVCLSIDSSTHPPVCPSLHLPINPCINECIHPSVTHPLINLTIYLSIHPSIQKFIHPSNTHSLKLAIHLSVPLSIHSFTTAPSI